ncbi:MAG: histidine ammonia-lyase [Phycisphaerales bacterium]
MNTTVALTTAPLTPAQVESVARGRATLELAKPARDAIRRSRDVLEAAVRSSDALYGVNTGFGKLAKQRIDPSELAGLQRNLVRSHASGVGEPFPEETVRAMMTVLAASLCRGRSGVRTETVEALVAAINAGLYPVVPSIGSVGASGDLAPLAHAVLAMMGEGEAFLDGERMAAKRALDAAGLKPIDLGAKEGIGLLNGTHLMAGEAALLLGDIDRLLAAAVCANAMSNDGAKATDTFLDPRVYEARNQPGPSRAAERLRALLKGSEIVVSHRENDPRVQDPYSFRCAPIVFGAALDLLDFARGAVERELGAVTDNPLVFDGPGDPANGESAYPIVSAGCFHGMPIAIALDTLPIALAHIAGIAERRVFFITGASDDQNPLPMFLSPKPGLHSGLMIPQYAAAACVNELIGLANPASVANVPTCAGTEDYNSYGPRSAAKARRAIELAEHVIAVELLTAAETIDYHRPLKSGAGVERAHRIVREVALPIEADRPFSADLAAIRGLIRAGRFVEVMPE